MSEHFFVSPDGGCNVSVFEKQQSTLDRVVILNELKELKTTVEGLKNGLEEQKKMAESLKERVIKLESDAGVVEAGYHAVYNALEINGLMSNGEATVPGAKTEQKSQKEPIAAVKEETFTTLKFEDQQGAKLGQYAVAYKQSNLMDKWTSAYNILRQSNATIQSRYHGSDYQFSYWLYGESKIYRQRLKAKP